MPRNGSGSYSLPAGNPVVTGTTISSTWANNTLSDIGSALTASIAVDGQTPPTANLPMGGFKHTGAAVASALTDYARADQLQNSAFQWLTSVAGTNTITASAALTPAAYVAGQTFRFVSAGANTGAVTLNVNGLGAQNVTKFGSTALVAGDIPSGAVVSVTYDGTRFQLVNVATAASLTMSTARVLGRTTAGVGAVEELTVGAGLSLSGGALSGAAATDTVQGIVELATTAEARTGTDTTRAVTPAGLGASVLGIGQTYNFVTASRALSTVYTNTTGRPILVQGWAFNLGAARIEGRINGSAVWAYSAASGAPEMPFVLLVPNGLTYQVQLTGGSASLSIWAELS